MRKEVASQVYPAVHLPGRDLKRGAENLGSDEFRHGVRERGSDEPESGKASNSRNSGGLFMRCGVSRTWCWLEVSLRYGV